MGEENMKGLTYERDLTALLVIDPYNDFLSENGKIWHRVKGVAEANKCIPNMLHVLNAARSHRLNLSPSCGAAARLARWKPPRVATPEARAAYFVSIIGEPTLP